MIAVFTNISKYVLQNKRAAATNVYLNFIGKGEHYPIS